MDEITADYWKGIVRGVTYIGLATVMFATQTSVVKWGHMIGYTAAVIVIFRGVVQFVCCFVEAIISIKRDPDTSALRLRCNVSHICRDLRNVGIVPRRTIIPIFHENPSAVSRSALLALDYGSFKSTTSYSNLLAPDSPSIAGEDAIQNDLRQTQLTPAQTGIKVIDKTMVTITSNAGQSQVQTQARTQSQSQIMLNIQQAGNTPTTQTQSLSPAKNGTIRDRDAKKNKSTRATSRYKSYKCLIWSAVIGRGVLGGVGTLLLFQAAMFLPVGDMQSLMALTAAITPFFAFIFFRDTLTKLHMLSLVGAVIGVVLIVQPSFIFHGAAHAETIHASAHQITMGYMYAIAGSAAQAMIYICIQFARKTPVYILTMSQSLFGILTGMVTLAATHKLSPHSHVLWIDDWFDCAYILLLGCVGYVFLWLVTKSGRFITSGVIALLLNLSIVWGYMIEVLVFDERPTWITVIGAVCMFVSAAVVSVDKIHDAKKKSMSVIERNLTTNVGV